ncbi:MAG: DUF2142 domain-containing protein [Eubacteriales bacterium]|nr:DUF2142 domain-containing protein [Eubacteriales bacterium]
MNKKNKFILSVLVAVYVLAAIFIVASTSAKMFKLAKCIVFAPGVFYVVYICKQGVSGSLAKLKKHWQSVLLLLILEAVLAAYQYYFVYQLQLISDFYIQVKLVLLSVFMGMIEVFFFLYKICHVKIEHIWAAAALVTGMIFILILPVQSIPDEPAHMETAYAISNHILGIPDVGDGYLLMRRDDAEYPLDTLYNREELKEFWFSLNKHVEQEELVPAVRGNLGTHTFQHLMPALGLTLGRLLKMSTAGAYTLGRIFALLTYILLTWLSIRLLPFGKMLLFTIALMPMSMQMGMSYSYDSLLIPLSWLILSITLHLAYPEKEQQRAKKAWLLPAASAICEILLILQKDGAYIIFAFVPAVIFFARWKKDRRAAWTGAGLVLIGLLAFVAPRMVHSEKVRQEPEAWVIEQAALVQERSDQIAVEREARLSGTEAAPADTASTSSESASVSSEAASAEEVSAESSSVIAEVQETAAVQTEAASQEASAEQKETTEQERAASSQSSVEAASEEGAGQLSAAYYDEAEKFSAGELLRDRRTLWLVLYNTLITFDSYYLESAIASPLGWLSVTISRLIIYAWLVLLILSALMRKEQLKNGKYLNRWNRLWLAFVGIGGVLMILAAMLLFYSPKSHMRIEGVQGRYLIPFFLPFLFCLQSESITAKAEDIDWKIVSAVCTCLYFTVAWIIP